VSRRRPASRLSLTYLTALASAISIAYVARPCSAQEIVLRPPTAGVQERGDWNGPRVTQLVSRAIERRASWASDDRLQDYRAHARGHIYFLYDLGRNADRHLVKADQLALDLYWRTPDRTRQIIVGRKEEKALPTNIRYHLDHLTVVMDNFGDRIYMGEGAEVRDALHPAAPGALDFYEYRLTDSLTLVLPEGDVQVYKAELRPRNSAQPGLVGAIYLDRATADIVRMEFTFTAASYIDDTLDYINVHLENAMWEGRYWLPYRQGIELRREVGLINFPAGGIIRAEFAIGGYRFNTSFPDVVFRGPRVSALPASARESYEFQEGLYDALDPEVATAPPSLEEIRREATRIVSEDYLRQARGLKLAVPGVSSVFRFRRAEGLYLGPGVGRDYPSGSLGVLGGYSFGASRWQALAKVETTVAGRYEVELAGYYNRVADVSIWQPSSGIIATLSALIDGEDHREPYWASGGRLTVGQAWGRARARISLGFEDWEAAQLTATKTIDRGYREVRELDAGEVAWLAFQFDGRPVGAVETVGGASWDTRLEGATRQVAGDFEYVQLALRVGQLWPDLVAGTGLRLSAAAGAVGGGTIPAQRLFAAGGRGTVRGYSFHRFVGNLYGAVGLELARRFWYPYVSIDLFADMGWVGIEGNGAAAAVAGWNRVGERAGATRGPLIGVGAGVGLVFDILWVELARGVRQGGNWELIVRVRSEFWPWL
jgi:hypothetical protein